MIISLSGINYDEMSSFKYSNKMKLALNMIWLQSVWKTPPLYQQTVEK